MYNKMRSASVRRTVDASRRLLSSKGIAGNGEACNGDGYRIRSLVENGGSGVTRSGVSSSFLRGRVSGGAGFGGFENGRWEGDGRRLGLFSGTQSTGLVGARGFTTAIASPPVERGRAQDPYLATEIALDAVVKIFAVSSSPNYFLPWQNKAQREATGSGFVISGRRIVTNAHVVADQTHMMVRKHGSPIKYHAHIEAVGHECDLALLRVHDDEFWEGMLELELGDIPFLQESVAVVGYPQGGDNISVTGGVVSRVEPTRYVHGAAHLMAIQIDAAINPGNSGGPALMEDKVVGVAFQNLANAENIGYIIPVPVIKHFLADVEETGGYIGFCSLGVTCQSAENVQLREHLKMPPGLTGVLINKIHPLTDTSRCLKRDDVILAFDGIPIANDGTVHFRNRERISFDHLVSMKEAGETAKVTVMRAGQELHFDIKLGPLRPLVPIHQFDTLPSYYIFAGLVFTPLSQPYLQEYGEDWYNTSPRRLCERALSAYPTKPGQQLVILSQILMDEINAGYERFHEFQVNKVNGVEVHNLRHLRKLVEECTETSLRFDLDDNRVVVLDFRAAREASLRILQRHRIPSHTSKDLLEEEDSNEGNFLSWEGPWHKEENKDSEGMPVEEEREAQPV
ncbi:hypothetical protein KC19_1G185700 [Ceratodon purpureus]|uniref:Protease Do-like PDZ domain-containing protein n=1 Tax=Ceratodon purpureus TaxID=3225 RepID=A0A8T0J9J1_CERPU|nr:hypothetical protein KC19_1G185700 [Ceratodon purpureus]